MKKSLSDLNSDIGAEFSLKKVFLCNIHKKLSVEDDKGNIIFPLRKWSRAANQSASLS